MFQYINEIINVLNKKPIKKQNELLICADEISLKYNISKLNILKTMIFISMKYNVFWVYKNKLFNIFNENYKFVDIDYNNFIKPYADVELPGNLIDSLNTTNLILALEKIIGCSSFHESAKYCYTVNNIIDYIIITKQWNVILHFINNWNKCSEKFFKHFTFYLLLIPDNVLIKVYKYIHNEDLLKSYYLYSRLCSKNIWKKFVNFNEFVNDDKLIGWLLYTSVLLKNENYIKTKDSKISKYLYILGRLNQDLQLLISIEPKNIKMSVLYLS